MERYRTTLILAVLLAALAGLAIFLSSRNLNATATPTPEPAQFVWQESGDVTAIDVMSGTQMVSARKDVSTTQWALIAPVKEEADSFALGSAADNLKSLKAMLVLTGSADLAQYGLDKKGLSVEVKTAGDKPAKHTALVGNANIDGTGYF